LTVVARLAEAPAMPEVPARAVRLGRFMRRHPTIVIGSALLLIFALIAVLAPFVLPDPKSINPLQRLRPPSATNWFGTDQLGRSVLSRTLHGTRISLLVGVGVTVVVVFFGMTIGLVAGFVRVVDGIVMRVIDAVMAIPGVLLAVALMALFGSNVQNVIIAIAIPEIPRLARLVRSVVLSVREQPFVAAAITSGARLPRLLLRHVLPNTVAAVLVQATFVFASAMIVEAVLSFLGAGTPPEIPSWGNMMSEGRQTLHRAPWVLAFPGVALAFLVLVVNLLGDALRDALDPRLARRGRS
jgi:peptide/nickel transport system permease protein